MFEPMRPDRALRSLVALRRWGADAGGGLHRARRSATPTARRSSTSAARSPSREVHRRTNALARELRKAGHREGDGVAIMCRNHRGFIEATVACSKLGASALYLNTAFAGPQIADVLAREDPVAVIYDEEFAELVARGRGASACASSRGSEPPAPRARPSPPLEELIARGDDSELQPPRGEGARGDPDVGHDRHAEGRRAQAARLARAGGGAVLEDPAAGARDDDDRRADVPLLGVRALHAGAAAGLDARAAAQVRPRGDAAGGRPAPRERARASCR